MKVKFYIIITILLLFTNIVVGLLYLNKNNSYNLLLKMSGQSEHWIVKDYEIAFLADYDWCESGNANVTYLGNTSDIKEFNILEYCILIGGEESFQECGGNDFKNGMGTGSGGSGELPKHIKDDYLTQINENTYFIIEWTEYNGDKKSERVDLKIDNSLKETKRLINN
ncbi:MULTISPECIES: hypothetical protein [unclassified Clostridium]|uniref:hypothetical protein n=1 Tax=unclassified Clostridium TaxID=2614128 RepID=UPI001243330D